MTSDPTTLYRGGRVHSPTDPDATALLVSDGTVAWVGPDAEAPAADRVVDLDGALVTPAFVDAHVHVTDTGLTATGLDLSATRSAAEVLGAVATAARQLPADAVLLGHGWDESTWPGPDRTPPDAAPLDRAAGGRRVYLSQASIHSALCSPALLATVAPGTPGYDPSGWVRREAHRAAREAAFASISTSQRARVQRTALRHAASLGIAAVHECGGPGTSSEDDFTAVLALSGDALPEVYGYWGEPMGAERARQLGALGAGGDLYADGALGSQTAHLREPYDDRAGHHGHGYLTSEQVRDHLLDCHDHGVQGGFHAIGDAALAAVLDGFAAAAAKLGPERLRAARHRIEHAELVDRQMIARMVEYGVIASMQPAFDRLWGGESQMYAARLGRQRALEANPFGAMHAVGAAMAFGSDSPVTPLDPWGSVRAAACHHNPAYRMGVRSAFAAHTRGGWRAVGQDTHGVLTPGAPATFAVWHTPAGLDGTLPVLMAADPAERGPQDPTPLPTCRRTVLRGRIIYDQQQEYDR
jgi:predicted amidohydrolase YtcJ